MAFDSEEYLKTWKRTGKFPQIHDAITGMVHEVVEGKSMVDVCCSTGILGTRLLATVKGSRCFGIEMDPGAIALNQQYGLPLKITPMRIEPATLQRLGSLLRANGTTVMVARRCFSEIFKDRPEWGPVFARFIADQGVKELVLQGRVYSARSTHPIPDINAEVALVKDVFKVIEQRGQVAALWAR